MPTWQSGDLPNSPALPSGKPLHFNFLLPAGWSATGPKPALLIDEHENDQGSAWYASGQDDLPTRGGADGWYNNTAFQAAYGPVVILTPCCDQTTDSGGVTENFGGWTGTGAGAYGPNLASVIQLAQYAIGKWNVDPARIYITGRSLGGIGTEAAMIDANTVNGPTARVFAAGLAFAGVIERYGGCPLAIAQQLSVVPLFMVSGANDTTSRVQDFNQPLWKLLAGPIPYPPYPGARAGASKVRYLQDPALGHDVWDTYMPLPKGKPLWDWLFSQRAGGITVVNPLPASADQTIVKAGSSAAITDASGNAWTITSGAQIAVNGVTDTTTANVVEIATVAGVIWQINTAGNWYSKSSATASWAGPTTTSPLPSIAAPSTAAKFSIRQGHIYDPAGNIFFAEGLNNRPTDPSTASAILSLFPNLTFVRMAMDSFVDPAAWNGFVTTLEAAHVVCEAEYHPWPMQNALTGAALATEVAWAAAWASYYKGRPYVWIGSMNEPQGGSMTPEHVAVYNAVRAVDPTKMVMLVCGIGGGNPGAVGAASLTPSAYAAMTNIVWDLHFYGWVVNSTDQATVSAKLLGSVASATGVLAAQAVTSADGVVPVIIGEFGPSTSGTAMDPNAAQVIAAVIGATETSGFAGWAWDPDAFNCLEANGARTAWGQTLASAIAPVVSVPPPPPPPPPLHVTLQAQIDQATAILASVRAALASETP